MSFSSEEFVKSIEKLVDLQQKKCLEIKGIQPALAHKKTDFETLLEDCTRVRGRSLFYNYMGSGRGQGPYVELLDGSVKLDFINGIGVHIFGHCHPDILKASLHAGLSDIVMQGHLQMNHEYLRFSQKVLDLAEGSRLIHGWICPSGSMANENALKMLRQKNSPARKIIAMESSFAGRTTMMAEITDNPKYKQGLPDYGEVLRIPFYEKKDPDSGAKALSKLKKHIAENPQNICCFYFEPMLGEGGYKVAPREFFIPLFEECRKHGIGIWADEVQTFLRTGEPFAFQTIGFSEYVDLCTIAKTAQCGMTLYTEEYNPKPGLVAGTFASSSQALAVGLTIMEEMETRNYFGPKGKIAGIHREFMDQLRDLCEGSCKSFLCDPEGLGLMIAVTAFGGDRDRTVKLLKRMFDKGLMAFGCGKNPFRLRFLLPAILDKKEMRVAREIMEESILGMSNELS